MDASTAETAAQTVKGLAALAAIPIVLFALWADYFGRYLKSARKSMPGFDPRIERERVRVAGACVLLFELILSVGAFQTLQQYPKSTLLGLAFILVAIGWIQTGLERQLVPLSLSSVSETAQAAAKKVGTGWRALGLALLSGLLYIATLVCFVRGAAWISGAFHFSTLWSAAFLMTAAAAGIFSGLALNFALAPWQLRHSLPVSRMSDEERATVNESLRIAGLHKLACWIVEDRQATAAIAGFRWGRGIFRPALFISRTVMKSLTPEEIKAVVAHEAAHALARHLRKRVLLSAALIVGLTFLAVFLSLATFTYFPASGLDGGFGMIFGMTAFIFAFYALQKQSRVHEFEADWIAIQKLGADFESWSSALRKMDQLNGLTTRSGAFSTHPKTELRIQNVAKMLQYFGRAKVVANTEAPSKKDDEGSGQDRAA